MKIKMWFILLLAIVLASIGIADASIRSNQETVFIGGSPPDIVDNPTDYFLTTSDIQSEVRNYDMRDSNRLCKPYVENGVVRGVYAGNPRYCDDSKEAIQDIYINQQSGIPVGVMIIGLHPSVSDSDYDAMIQNIKDTYSIETNYRASFENIPQLGDRAFYMPTTIPTSGGSGYDNTLIVQSGNVVIRISFSSKDTMIDLARKYISKISQVRGSQPNLIIQASADKTVLEVGDYYNSGDRFNIEFKSTASALITVKNSNQIIDSFVLEHSDSRNYIADKASGNEMIEVTGITAKGKTDSTQLSITTKNKETPTPTPMWTPTKQSPGFDIVLALFSVTILLIIRLQRNGKLKASQAHKKQGRKKSR